MWRMEFSQSQKGTEEDISILLFPTLFLELTEGDKTTGVTVNQGGDLADPRSEKRAKMQRDVTLCKESFSRMKTSFFSNMRI